MSDQTPTKSKYPQYQQYDQREKHALWIAGRIDTLLKHFYEKNVAVDVAGEILRDWIKVLMPYPEAVISDACDSYIRNEKKRRPTPADIRSMCQASQEAKHQRPSQGGSYRDNYERRATLDEFELRTLEERILPTARKWIDGNHPDLAGHGRRLLEFWGESIGQTSTDIAARNARPMTRGEWDHHIGISSTLNACSIDEAEERTISDLSNRALIPDHLSHRR